MRELLFRQSYALDILKCPIKVFEQIENEGTEDEDKPSRKMEKGSLVHGMVLGGAQLHTIQATIKSGKNKGQRATKMSQGDAKKEAEEVRARGFIPVFKHEIPKVEAAAISFKAKLIECGVELDKCELEQERFWTSPEGIKCRGTPDLRSYGKLVVTGELKHGFTADPDELDAHVFKMGYDIQAAAYEEEYRCNGGDRPYMHVMFCGEDYAPYECTANPLHEIYLSIGRWRWSQAKAIWAECLKTNVWPGYKSRPLMPPAWVLRQFEASSGVPLGSLGL